jgi:diazepam-binding inhibitor (GABA receptor modulator, acyl-CoA-binding protein)
MGRHHHSQEDCMSELDDRFTAAADASKTLPARPDNDTLLQMYALYKQGTVGDVEGKRPGFTDPVGKAKYDAWDQIKGMSADDAKAAYADLVEGLAG